MALTALATGGFAVGTTEFASMTLLPWIAEDLGITIPQAGMAVSAYAIGVVVGAPLLTALTPRMDRKLLLILAASAFTLGNLLTILAVNLPMLLGVRFLTGLPHGITLGIAAIVAAGLVPPERSGTAISRTMLGLTIANIVGVPAATALGSAAGWRAAYVVIAVIGLATIVGLLTFLPAVPARPTSSARAELKTMTRPQVWLPLLAGAVGFGGSFALYTYITPTVTQVTGIPGGLLPWVLVLYGCGMTAGSLVAGPCLDRSIDKSALAGVAGMGVILALFALLAHIWWIALPLLFLNGIAMSLFTNGLQARLLRESPEAPNMSAAMNHAAFNAANALGAYLGGVVVAAGLGYRAPAAVGVLCSIAGTAVLLIAFGMGRRRHRQRIA
ncbi:MFS transporter [Brevibacterium yomogidense]|uniref:MFS permease n=1 Tax=Brevibacterium yomogidense TaxID=946573 RepID=A0A1X6XMZ8_9MICO|nr:MFS transporter [Brevibacterium yomogidense]SLN00715.1 MFS permease [Brevibacterium yomogidense]